MKTLINLFVITSLLFVNNITFADAGLSFMKQGLSYAKVKAALLEKGWTPVKNARIDHSSLYAQEIYDQGMEEVDDCISMELDACVFRFTKNNQVLEIKTITRQLTVESFRKRKK